MTWNYDASFRVTTERINGANPITFAYDTDSLLTGAGSLTYTRRAITRSIRLTITPVDASCAMRIPRAACRTCRVRAPATAGP